MIVLTKIFYCKNTENELKSKSNFSARSKTQGSVAIQKEKTVQGWQFQNSDPMNSILRKVEVLGLNASAGHT